MRTHVKRYSPLKDASVRICVSRLNVDVFRIVADRIECDEKAAHEFALNQKVTKKKRIVATRKRVHSLTRKFLLRASAAAIVSFHNMYMNVC